MFLIKITFLSFWIPVSLCQSSWEKLSHLFIRLQGTLNEVQLTRLRGEEALCGTLTHIQTTGAFIHATLMISEAAHLQTLHNEIECILLKETCVKTSVQYNSHYLFATYGN